MRVKPCGGHIAVCSDMDGASPQQNLQLKRACCVSHMCLLTSFITTTVRQRTSIKMTKKGYRYIDRDVRKCCAIVLLYSIYLWHHCMTNVEKMKHWAEVLRGPYDTVLILMYLTLLNPPKTNNLQYIDYINISIQKFWGKYTRGYFIVMKERHICSSVNLSIVWRNV